MDRQILRRWTTALVGKASPYGDGGGSPAGWTAAFFALLGLLIAFKMLATVDTDLFFHLKEGERIVEEGRLPLIEEYSYTVSGRAMVATEWLAQAITYLVFKAGGYGGLVLFYTALILAAFRVLFGLTAGVSAPSTRFFLMALTAFAFLNFYSTRIHCFAFLLMAVNISLILRWERGRWWAPWAMAASLLPWVNMHGSFMLGWGLLAVVCGLDFLKSRRLADLSPLLLGTLLCCAHPNGMTAFIYPLWFMGAAPEGRSMVLEWSPLDFGSVTATPYLLLISVLAWVGLKGIPGRFPWAHLILALLTMSLRGRKLLPMFTLTAVAAMSFKLREGLGRWETRVCRFGTAAILLFMSWVVWTEARRLPFPNPAAAWERSFPKEAVELISERYADKQIFHTYDWGGYLIYKLHPGTRVFIDGRLDPYWKLLATDYRYLIEGYPNWRKLLDDYGVELALLPPSARLAHLLNRAHGWRLVHLDRKAVIFLRRPPPKP